MAGHQPHLLDDLRLALASLYSLKTIQSANKPTSHQAHEFLMQFQSRNTKRKLQSMMKSHRHKHQETRQVLETPQLSPSDIGSSWLATVAILSAFMGGPEQQHVNYAEALFGAQTLVHRLRHVKLSEAIDIEFEQLPLPEQPDQMFETYRNWMQHFHPVLGHVLQKYQPHTEDEDSIKGEVTMITLATILYCTTLSHSNNLSALRPLLSTLGSALAVTAARLRYTSISLPNPAPNTQPVVTMILHSLHMVHQAVSQPSPDSQRAVYALVLHTCLAAIPDAILAGSNSGGGATGRLSMDPRCFTAVTTEVRTEGISLAWQALVDLDNPQNDSTLLVLFLNTCQEWAKYVPLPLECVQTSVPLIIQALGAVVSDEEPLPHQSAAAAAAMAYWIAVMEGGHWSVDQVLASSLIQKQENSQQSNKKRQSSRSKKRQKEVLDERTTDDLLAIARSEVAHRGEVACQMALLTWNAFWTVLIKELQTVTGTEDEVQGDGPVGGITSAANACLPYLLRQPRPRKESLELFVAVAQGVKEICKSPVRMVRAFASETLYTLHGALMEIVADRGPLDSEVESVVVNHFLECSMNLATQCGYPPKYFHNLGENNDEELESERNDVRDIVRTITGGDGKFPSEASLQITSQVLVRILHACAETIEAPSRTDKLLFPETALHAFSALAKPINQLAERYSLSSSENVRNIFKLALGIMATVGHRLVTLSPQLSMNDLLPLSRLANLAVASYPPMLSVLVSHPEFETETLHVIRVSIKSAALSIVQIPELAAASSLRSTRYDIRGAMRTPGGEDHVGCLALMRLALESNSLALCFIRSEESIVAQLCRLYEQLKTMENERGQGVFHGRGVLPKSRRILLGIICHLEIVTAGEAGVSDVLRHIFDTAVNAIASVGPQTTEFSAEKLFRICENVFDLSAFSPTMVAALYDFDFNDASSQRLACMKVLHQAGLYGFRGLADQNITHDVIIQWNRLRAAIFSLLQVSGAPDLPIAATEMVVAWIRSECEAVLYQCSLGPTSSSTVFDEKVISEDTVPAGLFVRAVSGIIEQALATGHQLESLPNCLRVLQESRLVVLHAVTSECPDPVQKGSFCDPRPTLSEAWLCTMDILIQGVGCGGHMGSENFLQELLVQSCASCVCLLLYSTLGKTVEHRLHDAGMSMDGPQTLALTEFLQHYFDLTAANPSMLHTTAACLLGKVPIYTEGLATLSADPSCLGISIIGAGLFRAAQGGLPPWAVEAIPPVYSSLFQALHKDPDAFGLVFRLGIHVRLVHDRKFGGVEPGCLLSGRFFEVMNEKAKHSFVTQAVEISRSDTPADWKKLKAHIKQACGGKKKDTDFKQRPGFTKWAEMDRV